MSQTLGSFGKVAGLVSAIGALTIILLLLRRLLFVRGSRGNVPSEEQVRAYVAEMDDAGRDQIASLHAKAASCLPVPKFVLLAVATALSIEHGVASLFEPVVLGEYLDSLSRVEFVMLLEEMFDLEIADEVAEQLLTFEDVVRYVEATTAAAD